MNFHREQLEQDRMYEGLDAPAPSRARIFLDLYALQDMSPEARLAKAEKLDAVFAKIKQDWKEEGFANDEKL